MAASAVSAAISTAIGIVIQSSHTPATAASFTSPSPSPCWPRMRTVERAQPIEQRRDDDAAQRAQSPPSPTWRRAGSRQRSPDRAARPPAVNSFGMMNARASIAAIASIVSASPAPRYPRTPGAAHDAERTLRRTRPPSARQSSALSSRRERTRMKSRLIIAGGSAGSDVPIRPRSLVRSSSATRIASTPSRMICGRMKMISSVRCDDLALLPISLPTSPS